MAAVMCADAVNMLNNLHEQAQVFELLYDRFSRFITVHTLVLSAICVDRRIIVHDVDLRKIMTLADLKIVRVMCRRDLYATGTELFINIRICHNRDLAVYDWQDQCLSDQILITLILRIDCNSGIAKHRFRTGGRDLNISAFFACDRIFNMPEMSGLLLMLYFGIGNRCLAKRTPVDDTGSFVDITLIIQTQENFLDCCRASFIHGKALALPVSRGSKLL